jgi:hypothetical protein
MNYAAIHLNISIVKSYGLQFVCTNWSFLSGTVIRNQQFETKLDIITHSGEGQMLPYSGCLFDMTLH